MIDRYLSNLTRVLGIGAGFASIPLLLSFANLQPPFPPAAGPLSAAIVLIAALVAWEWTRSARRRDRRWWIVSSVVLTAVGLTLYLILYSSFIETIPGSDFRVVKGYECTVEAAQVFGSHCPDLSRDALRDNEWEANGLWTRNSITVVRVGLILSWLLFLAGLITAVGAVVAGRRFSS